jgi:N-acyl-D-aspartate/D-glutamate deacylase
LAIVADIRIAILPNGAAEPGRTTEEIARERRCDPLDVVCDVIIADKGASRILVRSMSEADVRAIAADPSALVGSDGPCVAPYGITGQGKPHPRLYGTFPRLIGHYARDLGLLTLPQAIAKMTGGAAAALGLADRGTGTRCRMQTFLRPTSEMPTSAAESRMVLDQIKS